MSKRAIEANTITSDTAKKDEYIYMKIYRRDTENVGNNLFQSENLRNLA